MTGPDRLSGVLGPWAYTRDETGWRWVNAGDPALRVEHKTWSGGPTLVVGDDQHGTNLVVIELEHALTLAKAWDAVRLDDVSRIVDKLPEPYRSELEDRIAEAALADTQIDTDWVYMWARESGLEWPAQDMLTLLPDSIIDQFGEESFSGVSGPCLLIGLDRRSELVDALRALGYRIIEDDALTAAASGADP